jgi:tRNA G18 (ribose-2'-O)-methylase SpoU
MADLVSGFRAAGAAVFTGQPAVIEAVTGFHVHRGALGSFGRLPVASAAEILAASRRILVLEEVNSPTNLGAIFRSAAGLGMDAVLLSPTCCDPLYRRAVRVSMGEVLSVPYAYVDRWPAGLSAVRDAGFRVLALTPAAGAVALDAVEVAADDRVAVLLGAEGPGLSAAALATSDTQVRIPMSAGVDSLNVAAAAAVACWAIGHRA